MTVGELLKQLRKSKKMSQLELAEIIGWTESRVSKVERDISDNIGLRTIEKYLRGLGIRALDFFNMLYK